MRILVITRSPWLKDNSIGNTLCDFFSDFSKAEIFSLCLKEAPRVCDIPIKNYYMSEYQILKSLMGKGKIGKITDVREQGGALQSEENIYFKAKQIHSTIPHLIREFVWNVGKWKNERLDQFLVEASPEVIFFPVFPCVYAHKVLKYIKSKTGARVVIFHADDCYTLKFFSLSPLAWLFRLYIRKWVARTVRISDIQYVISDVQKEDYDKSFHLNHKVLTKFAEFNGSPELKQRYNEPLQAVFTGNINVNRWKSLAIIARAFEKLNENKLRIQLRIYTATKITHKVEACLNRGESSFLMGKVSAEMIPEIQNNADLLVHVEGLDIKNRLKVRQSFSTKLVDYMQRGRAILAIGPKDVASIKHLINTQSALVADNELSLINILSPILEKPELLNSIAINAYECGKQYHNKNTMLSMLYEDISSLCRKQNDNKMV